eukprot:gene7753-15862_t
MDKELPDNIAFNDYLKAFGHSNADFLNYYDSNLNRTTYTRGEFLYISLEAINVLLKNNVTKGDKVIHHFSENTVEDLAFRTASIFLGSIPVTVNWQADNEETVHYKISSSVPTLLLIDNQTPGIVSIRQKFPSLCTINTSEWKSLLLQHFPPTFVDCMDHYSSIVSSLQPVLSTDIRCIIFTSGTTGHPKGVELSYSNYKCNQDTFEQFLNMESTEIDLIAIVVNPLHHTNSTSITDWALRRPNSVLHLFAKYTTGYWSTVCDIVQNVSIHIPTHTPKLISTSTSTTTLLTTLSSTSPSSSATTTTSTSSVSSQPRVKRFVAPLVSRHVDFLASLIESGSLSVSAQTVKASLSQVVLLLGSAPVGPTTTDRLLRYAGRLPTVRFGSTETTLQVCGIPLSLPQDVVLRAFRAGWNHSYTTQPLNGDGNGNGNNVDVVVTVEKHKNEDGTPTQEGSIASTSTSTSISTYPTTPGYYIGRHHYPHTLVEVVKSVSSEDKDYMQMCMEGEPGYLIAKGDHVMTRGYLNQPTTSEQTSHRQRVITVDGWYLGLGDRGFWLHAEDDSSHSSNSDASSICNVSRMKDLYWQSRDSHMLIKGGANYSFEQIAVELSAFICSNYDLPRSTFAIAVCGLRLQSEHEDECCVMLELITDEAQEKHLAIESSFIEDAKKVVSKGAKPDRLLIGAIPMVQSKGVISVPDLMREFKRVFYAS